MAKSFHLLVAVPDKEPISFLVSGESVSLGRSPDNDIQILVREVSTSHLEFHLTEAGYEITDVGSTNGTKVNDQSVKNGQVGIKDRDFILLGETIPAYFIETEEGEAIDIKALIAEVDEARVKEAAASLAASKPKLAAPPAGAVKKIAPPGAVKKVGVPLAKPPVSKPLQPTPAESPGEVGSPTVKLSQPSGPVTKKLAPPVKKLAPPGPAKKASLGAAGAAPATKLPSLAKKTPAVAAEEPAAEESNAPKLAVPGGGPSKKLAVQSQDGPAKKLAIQAPEGAPVKKLAMPAKKAAPKLNMPKDE